MQRELPKPGDVIESRWGLVTVLVITKHGWIHVTGSTGRFRMHPSELER